MKQEPPEVCPVCGEDVPRNASACPECGADHLSGWREDADTTGGLGLPDEEFNYEDFVEREFGGGVKPPGIGWVWWAAAVAALLAFVAMMFL
ncbi:MAG: hypothetical protein IAE97_08745 [Chthoniobacterales bacterium]|nr:hypothetical protein [Chthoniobacterales bacterium]